MRRTHAINMFHICKKEYRYNTCVDNTSIIHMFNTCNTHLHTWSCIMSIPSDVNSWWTTIISIVKLNQVLKNGKNNNGYIFLQHCFELVKFSSGNVQLEHLLSWTKMNENKWKLNCDVTVENHFNVTDYVFITCCCYGTYHTGDGDKQLIEPYMGKHTWYKGSDVLSSLCAGCIT